MYGPPLGVSQAKAAMPELAVDRNVKLSVQLIVVIPTYFLLDKTRVAGFTQERDAVGKAAWDPALV
jgi:uncharacterized protein